jgi:hypothetical protein
LIVDLLARQPGSDEEVAREKIFRKAQVRPGQLVCAALAGSRRNSTQQRSCSMTNTDQATRLGPNVRGSLMLAADDLEAAVVADILTVDQAQRVWAFLSERGSDRPRFDGVHVAYYGGGLIVIAAMGWLLTNAWETAGGAALILLALAYGAAFWLAGDTLWKRGLVVPGGLLFTTAICMVPLATYGAQRAFGLWPQGDPGVYRDYYIWIKGSWIYMEIATIAAGLVAIKLRRFPFLVAPIAFALWFMSMDLAPIVYGRALTWEQREWVSLWFGFAVLLASYLADLRSTIRQDFAFWGYLFGLMAFWGGLSLMEGSSEASKLLYCLINLVLIVLSVLLRQRSFIVFGALGVLGYLAHLSMDMFADSLLFPIVLTMIGIAIIWLGVVYQRNSRRLAEVAQASLPPAIRELIPPRARS